MVRSARCRKARTALEDAIAHILGLVNVNLGISDWQRAVP
jgi:hypothetical protein